MKTKLSLYCVFVAGFLVCASAISSLYWSIRTLENQVTFNRSPAEMRLLVDAVIEKIEAGNLTVPEIIEVLNSGHKAFSASYETTSHLIKMQEGLLGVVTSICTLYLLVFLIYLLGGKKYQKHQTDGV